MLDTIIAIFSSQAAAFFITMKEDHRTIAKCLSILADWATQYDPLVFLTDQDSASALAIAISFPDAKHFLCDFHLKKCWLLQFRCMEGEELNIHISVLNL